ncbi:MAG: hypothetical protein M3M94_05680 [Actinomycetota bacterium]|nr:hypothetical protein [Actinomycetota bacterium]
MIERSLRPRGPYSLALSGSGASDATRIVRGASVTGVLDVDGRLEPFHARQRLDGVVVLSGHSERALERLRFVLALDDDHSDFLRRFARDALLGRALSQLAGLRPLRVATVGHALLRALCGQLIEARRARAIERRIVRALTSAYGGLNAPPTARALASFSPAELCALGLGARKGAALVRICSETELERLREVPVDAAAARLERERGLGPWSVGVVCLEGLGCFERGLVGDLGLVKLCAALRGRWVEGWETAELLEPYGEWAGLASVYLLAAFARGLVPGASPARARATRPRGTARERRLVRSTAHKNSYVSGAAENLGAHARGRRR